MCDRMEHYRKIWERIRETYYTGYMKVEHGLQAALYAEFRIILPNVNVVVEPRWYVNGKRRHPDLVIVEEETITDIFELKFKPWGEPKFKKDINRLLEYPDYQEYPVRLSAYEDPDTYQERNLPLHQDVRLHFVAVGLHNAPAVQPHRLVEEMPVLQENPGRLNHWFGRVRGDTAENREWSIEFGI